MLSTPNMAGVDDPFARYFPKAVSVILTGHFFTTTINPVSVAANLTAEQTFTVSGLRTTDHVTVNKPSLTAGLGIAGCRVSAADTLAITYINTTASAIDPASEDYSVVVIRREKE